jgi:hypothetical protein
VYINFIYVLTVEVKYINKLRKRAYGPETWIAGNTVLNSSINNIDCNLYNNDIKELVLCMVTFIKPKIKSRKKFI